MMRSMSRASMSAVAERGFRRLDRQRRRGFAGAGHIALADAGALHDPFVRSVDLRRQFGVRDDARRQRRAHPAHARADRGRSPAAGDIRIGAARAAGLSRRGCKVHERRGFQYQDRAAPRWAGAGRKPLAWPIISRISAEQFLTHHVIAQFHRAGVAFGVRAAMGLDDDAVKSQEHAAACPRTHFRAQSRKRLAREQEADLRHEDCRSWRRGCIG